MGNWMDERRSRLREFLGLSTDANLLAPGAIEPELPDAVAEQLSFFNIEWHIIPSAEALPMDDAYLSRFYEQAPRGFAEPREHTLRHWAADYPRRVLEAGLDPDALAERAVGELGEVEACWRPVVVRFAELALGRLRTPLPLLEQ